MKQRTEFAAALAAHLHFALAICAVPVTAAAQAPSCATGVVTTRVGPVCGTIEPTSSGKQAWAFRGIPYAESTAREKRWTPPVPKARWMQTFAAIRYGAICPQTPKAAPQQVAAPAPPAAAQVRKTLGTAAKHRAATAAPQPPTEDEDCLSLNIWTPASVTPNAGLPVMVFIHGGSFVAGSGADPMYDGAHLAANQNVVLVTINYRLGVLGFLAADGLSGNYGILDQQAALAWVREHIRSFGGDPGKVTIFGESAGSMSVGLHVFSAPGSERLFRAAIMESNFFSLPYKRLADQVNVGNIFKQGLNCRDLACLRKTPVNDIVTQQYAYTNEMSFFGTQYYIPFSPTIDGTVLVRQPVSGAVTNARKPIMLGTNKDEGLLFTEGRSFPPLVYASDVADLFGLSFQSVIARYPGSDTGPNELVWGQVQTEYFLICSTRHVAASTKAPVYAYLFNHHPSFKVWGRSTCRQDGNVCHGDELPFVFHSADKIGGQFTADEEKLSDAMGRYWTSFATHLDPNGAAATAPASRWPKFSARNRDYLALNAPNISVAADPYRETCAFWDGIGYELFSPWSPKPR
jgi:carboxylesterase type B